MPKSPPEQRNHPEEAHPRDVVSDLFHQMSQPLTALHCALELGLARDQKVEEFKATLESALQCADRLHRCLQRARALSDAVSPAKSLEAITLDEFLARLGEEMFPLFDSAGITLRTPASATVALADPARLQNALFHLLLYLVETLPRGTELVVACQATDNREIVLDLCDSCGQRWPDNEDAGFALEIARRHLAAMGAALMEGELPGDLRVRFSATHAEAVK